MADKPLAIDLFCGLGGWSEGLLAAGYDVIGFDIEQHVYGPHFYPAQLVLQDVLTLHGSQFRNATLIVASPPCQEYSYMAMPWTRAKRIAAALRSEDDFPEGYKGSRSLAELNALFDACFRIQREACEAAGRHVPLVVENVKGAQPWVGRARWSFGSYYLWGDVPALMPIARGFKSSGLDWRTQRNVDVTMRAGEQAIKNAGGSWFRIAHNTTSGTGRNPDGRPIAHTPHMTVPAEHRKDVGSGADWFDGNLCRFASGSTRRKAASAMIAKIPFELARHVAMAMRDDR